MHVFICFSVTKVSPVKQKARVCGWLLHLDPVTAAMRMLRWVCSLLFPRTSTINHRRSLQGGLKTPVILYTNCRLFTRVTSPRVLLASDWLLTFSNMFSDLLQHFYHIDTVDTKMLASDCLLFIAANQKPAFWCRYGYSISPTIPLSRLGGQVWLAQIRQQPFNSYYAERNILAFLLIACHM